jgi:hypothetical protein
MGWETGELSRINSALFSTSACLALGPLISSVQNDFISWLLDIAEGDQLATRPLTLRILSINMAAIHTTSMVSMSCAPLASSESKPRSPN